MDLEKSVHIGTLDGQIINWEVFESFTTELKIRSVSLADIGLYDEWNAISEEIILLRLFRTKYGFINHSRNPNIVLKNDSENKVIKIYTLQKIKKNEELTLDYTKEALREDYINGKGKEFL